MTLEFNKRWTNLFQTLFFLQSIHHIASNFTTNATIGDLPTTYTEEPVTYTSLPVTYDALPVTCVAGTFTIGSRGSVTCLFNRDVNATRHNFRIVRYGSRTANVSFTNPEGNTVLLCNWGARADDLKCMIDDGYVFDADDDVNNYLTVEIPVVSEDFQGTYACLILPEDSIPVHPCEIVLTDPITTPATGVFSVLHDDDFVKKVLIGLVVACFILFVVAFAAVCCLVKKKRKGELDADTIALTGAEDAESASEVEMNTSSMTSPRAHKKSMDAGQQTDPGHVTWSAKGSSPRKPEMVDCGTQVVLRSEDHKTQTEKQVHPVETWTADDVREWLMEVSVERYKPILILGMNGTKLLQLGTHKNELKKLGLDSGDAKRLKEKIADLKSFNDLILREEEFRRLKREWSISRNFDPEFADLHLVNK